MPVDYSKWDALEVSDDSDIEVHPNVDKKSFIRAKQAQIHQERARRRHEIATLKYERIINDGLMERIDRLLTALKSHKADTAQSADELVFQALIESAGDPTLDRPPPAPEGVHGNVKEEVSYSKMMAGLVDQVKKEVDETKGENRLQGFIDGVQAHRTKVEGLQKSLITKLEELEREEKRHITSDDIHTGFDYSSVSRSKPSETSSAPSKSTSTVELLNPNAAADRPPTTRTDTGQSSGADADIADGPNPDAVTAASDDVDENIRASPLAKQFAQIPFGDYRASMQFISSHPSILTERDSDALLVEAFDSQLAGKEAYARQCVHQALLLSYCRQLGRDGVALFFRRVAAEQHQARTLFLDDVAATHAKIRERAAALAAQQRSSDATDSGDREQIQLHAVDPSTTITIAVPPPIPADLNFGAAGGPTPPTEAQIAARRVFDAFPPGLQRALESGSLDEVNKVLAKMSVDQAEEVVEQLGAAGMLSLEEGVIDATNEEGKKLVEEIERTHRMPERGGAVAAAAEGEEEKQRGVQTGGD